MRFHTADLLSKWGFDDGDLIDNFLESQNFPNDIIATSPLWKRIFAELVLPKIETWHASSGGGKAAHVRLNPTFVEHPVRRTGRWE